MKKTIILLFLGLSLILSTGCEKEIKETNKDITVPRATYNQLLDSLETSKLELEKAREENMRLRNNNQSLNVNLAKSELTFTKKAENGLITKVSAISFIIISSAFLFFRREKEMMNTQLSEKEKEIDNLKTKKQKEIDVLEAKKKEIEETLQKSNNLIGELSKDLDILKLEQKQSSLNSVVNKIDELETKRIQMIKRIEVA